MSTKTSAKEYLKGWIPYRYQRYVVFTVVTLVALVLPFITIDGNHFFLLNFDHKQLHFMFVRFDMQELYLMPFLLLILFLGIFFITTLGGRVWCGWGCPQTIFRVIYRDFFETKLLKLRKRINNKQADPDMSKPINQLKKVVAILLWSALAFLASANFIWYFVPPEEFMSYLQNPAEHGVLVTFWVAIALFLIADVVFIKENFCVYICPYARVQSVMYDDDTFQTVYDYDRGGHIYKEENHRIEKVVENTKELKALEGEHAECTTCESCVKVCPTHIDIRKGMQLECINCLECADACTKVMGALGKESLVRWTSYYALDNKAKTRVFRFRVIAYIVALSLAFIGLLWMGTTKEHMLLNINRTTQLYKVDDGKVANTYVFLFQNTDSKDHKYYFEVLDNEGITIEKPKESFTLKARKKAKKIVKLVTNRVLVKNEKKDTPMTIKIRAFATDEPEKIQVFRDTVFVYPRFDLVDGKLSGEK
jgi:cytochrome c oxidase accessory protein FixG